MNLQNMKISTRLMLGFAAMVAMVVLLGAVALVRVSNIASQFDKVQDDQYPRIVLIGDIEDQVEHVGRALRNQFIMTDPADLRGQLDVIGKADQKITEGFDKLARTGDESDKARLAQVTAARTAYLKERDRVLGLLKAGKIEEAKVALVKDMRPVNNEYLKALDEMIAEEQAQMDTAGKAVDATVASTRWMVLALLGIASVFGFVLAVWIIRSTTRPLNEAVRVARAVAEGDLTVEFKADGTNETGQLLGAMHAMKGRLSSIVNHVRENAEGVATASAQIAQGNNDLSGRTEEQASALEETAASMEQLSSTVKQNADNARQANQLALGATEVAVKGGEVVGQVVDTMKGINESSSKIADIIGVIDGIAFQTNILALNAAVEAARAGEQGRGFAVVASEVRSLAQRSAEAAKEIKALISTSVERVSQGTQLVDQAGATMTEVVTAIRRVTDIMGEISAASHEQSAGVGQVSEAVSQMDQSTQQNAALVEQSAAAAESLRGQATKLVDTMAVFKLPGHSGTWQGAVSQPSAAAPHALPPRQGFKTDVQAAAATKPDWNGSERRGPKRATNVTRLPSPDPATTPKAVASGGGDDWESF